MGKKFNGLKVLDKIRGSAVKKKQEFKKKYFPTLFLNEEIEILDKNLEKYIQLQKLYCEYFHHQRLLRKNAITDIINECLIDEFESNTLWRVVTHEFSQDPLCTVGSIMKPPGGRFNFGRGLEAYEKFHCLYLGDSVQTCLSEKFHEDETYNGETISRDFLSLNIDKSHSSYKIKCTLENVIDLRDDKFMKKFLSSIEDIPDPVDLNITSKFYGWRKQTSIKTLNKLRDSLLDPNYTHSGMTYGLPSNSQWLGYYFYQHNIQAVIYPSVRNTTGYNIAVFVDNLHDSNSSYVQLSDEIKFITPDRRIINKSNIENFKKPEKL